MPSDAHWHRIHVHHGPLLRPAAVISRPMTIFYTTSMPPILLF